MWVWNPVALVGVTAFVVGLLFAAFVYFVRPEGLQNRRLALVLFFESLAWGTGAGLLFLTDDLGHAQGFQAIFQIALLVLPWVYLRFLATLDSPLSSWMRHRIVDTVLVMGAIFSPFLYFGDRSRFVTEFVPVWYAPLEAHLGPWFVGWMLCIGIVTLYALVVASHVVWRKRTTTDLGRARAYLYAFGIRDGIMLGLTMIVPVFIPFPPTDTWTDLIYVFGAPLATIIWIPIAAFGILRSQLFDIDLKIKLTIERSTLIAIFAGLAFLLSELIENAFVGAMGEGRLAIALLGAGILAFVFRKLPQRLADMVMPHAADAERLDARRLEVYRSACEGAVLDGTVDARESAVLERLRMGLGISSEEAGRIGQEIADLFVDGPPSAAADP